MSTPVRDMAPKLGLVLLIVGIALAAFFEGRSAIPVGTDAPPVEFERHAGGKLKLTDLHGKLVLLNFWATWCAPCLKEIPLLVEAQARHAARGLQIVGVAVDDIDPVRSFAQRLKVNYPLMAGGPEVYEAMHDLGAQLEALPFSVLIAPDGRILDRASGDLSAEELKEWLDAHLPSK